MQSGCTGKAFGESKSVGPEDDDLASVITYDPNVERYVDEKAGAPQGAGDGHVRGETRSAWGSGVQCARAEGPSLRDNNVSSSEGTSPSCNSVLHFAQIFLSSFCVFHSDFFPEEALRDRSRSSPSGSCPRAPGTSAGARTPGATRVASRAWGACTSSARPGPSCAAGSAAAARPCRAADPRSAAVRRQECDGRW